MNLQKKLIQLSEYKCSFKYVESYFLVSMIYPTNWSIIPSEDRSIEVAEEDGITFYAAPIETDIEKAFELIDDTITYNLDVEKKMALLKYNIGKLQELFAEKDLEELETIEFVFKTKEKAIDKKTTVKKSLKKVVSKTTQRKKKNNAKENNTITEEQDNTANGDQLIKTPNWGGFSDNCVDNSMYDDYTLKVTVEPVKTENKYLEEVER